MARGKTSNIKKKNSKLRSQSVYGETTKSIGNTKQLIQLKNFNIILAIIFAIQAISILVLSNTVKLPIVSGFLAKDLLASEIAGHTVLAPAIHQLFDVYIASLVVAFLLVSAAAHGAMATVHRKKYEDGLSIRVNKIRWIDYGIGAALMMYVIAMINGLNDIASLIMMMVLIVLLHGLAYQGEKQNKDPKNINWWTYGGMLLAGAAVWLAVVFYAKGAIIYGNGLPAYVYWVDISTFVLLLAIAVNAGLVLRQRGRWANYLFAERIYMILSLVLRTALAWQIFFGLLH